MCGRSKLASAECAPGDLQHGDWSRGRLIRMNERFVARMQRAHPDLERPPNGEAPERAA